MNKTTDFLKMLEEAKKYNINYIGTGNPESEILIIAKEPAFEKENEERMNEFNNNLKYWERDKDKTLWDIPMRDFNFYSPICPFKGQYHKIDNYNNFGTSKTWFNYQKLHNYIFGTSYDRINFHKNIFTTEMNSSPSTKTKDADKSSIKNRKEFIAESEFLQSFPVVILDGVGYYEISEYKNEIEEIFGVSFIENLSKEDKQPVWIHKDGKNSKLVINTYQMSFNVSENRLKLMGKIIKDFLNEINKDIKVEDLDLSAKKRWEKGGKEIYEKYQNDSDFVNTDEYKDYMTWS